MCIHFKVLYYVSQMSGIYIQKHSVCKPHLALPTAAAGSFSQHRTVVRIKVFYAAFGNFIVHAQRFIPYSLKQTYFTGSISLGIALYSNIYHAPSTTCRINKYASKCFSNKQYSQGRHLVLLRLHFKSDMLLMFRGGGVKPIAIFACFLASKTLGLNENQRPRAVFLESGFFDYLLVGENERNPNHACFTPFRAYYGWQFVRFTAWKLPDFNSVDIVL